MYTHFEEFSINTETFELVIAKELVQLDERVFQLFKLLIEDYPAHCSKQRCLDRIWPNTVVSDMSLAKLVSDTRKLFKKAGCQAPIIETVHGRGYRLSKELGQQLSSVDTLVGSESQLLPSGFEQVGREPSAKIPAQEESLSFTEKTLAQKGNLIVGFLLLIFMAFTLNHYLIPSVLTSAQTPVLKNNPQEVVYSQSPDAIGRILWVDDHPDNNVEEREVFRQQNIGVYSTTSTDEALLLLSIYGYEMVISDVGRREEPLAGLKLLRVLRESGTEIPYIIYTLNDTPQLHEAVSKSGGQGVAVDAESLFNLVMPHFKTLESEIKNQ
ncbi:winged helix-turn-helix domain-containing protein [Shewanella woodyi]|uniref:Transcriptional regulator, CadC n=1 Tax=Shewanella woodyi (strain ATCC 51908 / MS32) TaxID=392500 RepID=B1KEN9_SHEWM|nr:winged helix-turn-helix domain-containing protein [Shewanella woodyi]ACA88054.1 transcriptional regulator, CadC [Shewanella woodyi ATCC 51908]